MKPSPRPSVQKLAPYVPGRPIEDVEREYGITGAVKLASNENPLGPSPKAVVAAIAALLRGQPLPGRLGHLPAPGALGAARDPRRADRPRIRIVAS